MCELLDAMGHRYGQPPTVFRNMSLEELSMNRVCFEAGRAREARAIQDTKGLQLVAIVAGA